MFKCSLNRSIQICCAIVMVYIGYGNADINLVLSNNVDGTREVFRDAPARFGGDIPAEGFKGALVVAEPPEACQDIKPPPNDTEYQGNWIVLIARFNCTFEEKIRAAQKAGFDAAIVHNVGSNELEQMSARNATSITIPSVFVSERTGSLLKEFYRYHGNFLIFIGTPLVLD